MVDNLYRTWVGFPDYPRWANHERKILHDKQPTKWTLDYFTMGPAASSSDANWTLTNWWIGTVLHFTWYASDGPGVYTRCYIITKQQNTFLHKSYFSPFYHSRRKFLKLTFQGLRCTDNFLHLWSSVILIMFPNKNVVSVLFSTWEVNFHHHWPLVTQIMISGPLYSRPAPPLALFGDYTTSK